MGSLVSVIVPVYDCENFVGETIESVLNQTYNNLELILVDDCSRDNSLRIISEYASKDSRVKIIESRRNRGTAVAFNKGLSKAEGRYIALIDSDDLWVEDKLEKQIKFMREGNIDDPPPQGFFPKEPLSKLVDFSSVDSG